MIPLILNLGIGWRWVVSFTPRPLCSRKRNQIPINRRPGGPHSWSGHNV